MFDGANRILEKMERLEDVNAALFAVVKLYVTLCEQPERVTPQDCLDLHHRAVAALRKAKAQEDRDGR